MKFEERSYRKNLATKGLIYLHGRELEVTVKNLSVTGMLVALPTNDVIKEVKDIFQHVQRESTIIDVYLPELRLAGEAEAVWSEELEDRIELALEFRNLVHNVDNMIHARQAYRKKLATLGFIIFNNERYAFKSENMSLDGMMIRLSGHVDVEVGTVTRFKIEDLRISGEAKVIWSSHDEQSTLVGLEYLHMKKNFISGIPRFFSKGDSHGQGE